jgi:hypothetical protein
VVAAGAHVPLLGLVRLDPSHLDVVRARARHPRSAHARRSAMTTAAAMTIT